MKIMVKLASMKEQVRKIIRLFVIGLVLVCLSSCVSMPPGRVHPIPTATYPAPTDVSRHQTIHTVAPGETLWRISKIYDVDIEQIMQVNHLRQKDQLTMGQTLIIPGALPPCSVIPLYPSKKWQYIIIHHSATDVGNALSFYAAHKRRGFIHGLGYHFVIDNGSSGKTEGHIEVSPRWLKQQDGAHCKAAGMNYKGIGICLVGNFSGEFVSERQLASLVYLINILREYYNIPMKNIMGHGQVPGASTECPGKKFPWQEFYARIKASRN